MVEQVHEEKTARQLDTLSAALDSGVKHSVNRLLSGLSAAEIGDLLESLPLAERLVVWDLVDPEQDGEILVEVNGVLLTTVTDVVGIFAFVGLASYPLLAN